MKFMPTTRLLLRGYGLYPSENVIKPGFVDTAYIIILSLPLWFVLLTNYAYLEANIKTADIAVITDSMYTSFIFSMMCGNYFVLARRKIQIREVIDEIESITKRSNY